MSLKEQVMRRVVEPAVIRLLPVARRSPRPVDAAGDEGRPLPAVRRSAPPRPCPQRARRLDDGEPRNGGEHPAGPAVQLLAVHQRGYRPPAYPAGDPRAELPAADLLTMDPPDHTRIRRLVSGAFTPKAIAGLEPWIREVTGRLLDRCRRRGGLRPHRRAGLPAAHRGDLPPARRPGRGPGQLPGLGPRRRRHPGTADRPGRREPVARRGAGADRVPAGPGAQAPRRS